MTFRCPVCYYLKTHFKGGLCVACSEFYEVKPDGKATRKKPQPVKEQKPIKK